MTNEIETGVYNNLVFRVAPHPIPRPIFGWPWFGGLDGLIAGLANFELNRYGVQVTVANSGVDITYKGATVDLKDFKFDARTGTIDAKVEIDGFSSGEVALVKYNADGEITLTKTSARIIDMIAGHNIVSDHTSINLGELLWGWGPWGWPVGIVSPPAVHPEPIWVSPPIIVSPPIWVSPPAIHSPPVMRPGAIVATAASVGVAEAASGVTRSDKGALLGEASASLANHPGPVAAARRFAGLGGSAIVSSSADSYSGSLTDNGRTTAIASFDRVFGAAPPAYDDTRKVAAFDKTYDLSGADLNCLSLQLQGKDIVNTAQSSGLGVDAISASGVARLGSASFVLVDNPLPTLAVLGLSVEARGIRSKSNSSFVFGPDEGSITGDASFKSLTISGALVDGKTLTFSGDAKADTVLYSSTTVTITLDDQTLLLPPAGASSVIGPSITTDAIDIQFNNASFGGHMISGAFVIGQSTASYELMRA